MLPAHDRPSGTWLNRGGAELAFRPQAKAVYEDAGNWTTRTHGWRTAAGTDVPLAYAYRRATDWWASWVPTPTVEFMCSSAA